MSCVLLVKLSPSHRTLVAHLLLLPRATPPPTHLLCSEFPGTPVPLLPTLVVPYLSTGWHSAFCLPHHCR
jgi:hypothetical protein